MIKLASQRFLYQNIQFFNLSSNAGKCDLKILELLHCFNNTLPNCRELLTRILEKSSTLVFEVQIFISAMSHAAAKPIAYCKLEVRFSRREQNYITFEKQPTNITSSGRDTLTGSAKLAQPAYMNQELL